MNFKKLLGFELFQGDNFEIYMTIRSDEYCYFEVNWLRIPPAYNYVNHTDSVHT